jgi:hypothetical protein
MIVRERIPHGNVSLSGIADNATRMAVMKLNENVQSLARQLSELQGVCLLMNKELKAARLKITALENPA